MEVFRITKDKYIDDLSGEGARLYGGRWYKPGTAALYTSQHRSLALLELLDHFTSKKALRNAYSFISIEIPDEEIHYINLKDLPLDFHKTNKSELWKMTDDLFFRKKTLAIKVPSILIKNEFNVILNPTHPLYNKINVLAKEPAFLDAHYASLL